MNPEAPQTPQPPRSPRPNHIRALLGRAHASLAMLSPKYFTYSAIEFLYWMAMSAASFTVVLLQENKLSSSQVGSVMALINAVGIIAPPLWGMISDKVRSIKKTLIICLICGGAIYALVPLTMKVAMGPLFLGIVLLPVSSFFRVPTNSLMDSWMIRNTNHERNMNYGSVRLWGSIGYAIMAFLIGVIIKKLGSATITFYLFGLLSIPLLIMLFCQRDGRDAGGVKKLSFRELKLGRLLKNYYLVVFLLFNTILYLPVAGTFTFVPYLITEIAGNSNDLGTIFAIKALMEVPMLVASAYLVKRFGVVKMLFLGGILYTIEQYLYTLCGSIPAVVGVMVLHGMGFGIYLACSVSYIFALAPRELSATAQTICGALSSLAGIVGNLLGGYLIEAYSVRTYFGVAGTIVLASLLLFLLSFVIGKKLLHRELPEGVLRPQGNL
ncbi:MAG: MFS transporter [Eubacteriales bacterium]|nr:MFS transporter [Eubacteriales bacterium]